MAVQEDHLILCVKGTAFIFKLSTGQRISLEIPLPINTVGYDSTHQEFWYFETSTEGVSFKTFKIWGAGANIDYIQKSEKTIHDYLQDNIVMLPSGRKTQKMIIQEYIKPSVTVDERYHQKFML